MTQSDIFTYGCLSCTNTARICIDLSASLQLNNGKNVFILHMHFLIWIFLSVNFKLCFFFFIDHIGWTLYSKNFRLIFSCIRLQTYRFTHMKKKKKKIGCENVIPKDNFNFSKKLAFPEAFILFFSFFFFCCGCLWF